MPVPFEALLPYGIVVVMFGVSGASLSWIRNFADGGRRPRHGMDAWDRQMQDRDRRLTGQLRGQSDNPIAPPSFAINSEWKLEKRMI